MKLDRRRLFAALAGAASAATAAPAAARSDHQSEQRNDAQSIPARYAAPHAAMDASSLSLQPNAMEDQSAALQTAIDRAAAAHAVLHLPPGFIRAGSLRLPPNTAIAGHPGASRIVMSGGPSMMTATGSDNVSLSDLILDGANVPLPDRLGLVHLAQGRAIRIANCEITGAGRNGIVLEGIEGEVTGNTVEAAADTAIWSLDGRGLRIAGNTVRGAGNAGIQVWRSTPGDDGTIVVDNRIENISNKSGGTGQYGNGIAVFRANNVMVRGNRINNAAFSAVRGNSSSNLQILGNTCTGLGETAIYVEFSFEGAIVANNIVDGAAVGVSVTNFNNGGRLAVVQGNLIRNLHAGRPTDTAPDQSPAVGISIEADTVATGNVIEKVPGIGIVAGWGPYLRDVAVSANIVRDVDYGVAVSVASGAGAAVIADNLISGARHGAIVGMEWAKLVASDLSNGSASQYAQLSIGGNRVR